MPKLKPLLPHQQEAMARVREARIVLESARRNRGLEIERRMASMKTRISIEVDNEIAMLDNELDEIMLDAVNEGVPIRRIALDAFGATHDASVRRMIHEAMATRRAEEIDAGAERFYSGDTTVSGNLIPEPGSGTGSTYNPPVGEPRFTLAQMAHVLYQDAETTITAPTVTLELDPMDPWISTVADSGRKGSEHLAATVCTIYENPGDKRMIALESSEPGSTFYDHLAARWVKDHQEQARTGYHAALLGSISADADA